MPARPITPDMLPKLYDVAEQSMALNRLDEAAWCFERAAGFDPDNLRHMTGLGKIRHLQGRCEEARSLIERAIAHGGRTAECYTVLGQIHQTLGDFAEAIAAFEQAIALQPGYGHAHLRLALLRPAADPAAQIAILEQLLQAAHDPEQQAALGFALGREYDNAGDHARAFAQYQASNAARRAQYPGYSAPFASADRLTALFTPAFLAARTGLGNPSPRPVFIVGMMRSGTTLVEQILASHPSVHGHGELTEMRRIAQALVAETGGDLPYPDCLSRLDQATAARAAAAYLKLLEQQAPDAVRSVDKLPHNFENLGLVALLFPNARIIHCSRDPLDSCLSAYFHDFGPLNPFTYDLGTLGAYYRTYDRLMQHWQQVLPLPILTIPYEGLVADQEGWSRRAIEFLDLPWDAACLSYYRTRRPVQTKSLWQVRQPIYDTSIGRWRAYADRLGPLFDALGLARPA